ncbi:MAG: hypothetical protein LBV12_05210 [Puniceicoccales bacterium]|jgi:phosphoribosyl 1,2-cyclic phosphodiesterase|nr:hypothetical protein [Puniceicoccales bacterium]
MANGRNFKNDEEILSFIKEQLPFSVRGTYGTNTPCVSISKNENAPLLLDGGSGLRDAGLIKRDFKEQHMLLSHLHWDHIQGIPFYRYLYESDFHLIVHSCHPEAEMALREQMSAPFFPVNFDNVKAKVSIEIHKEQEPFDAGGFSVVAAKQVHPGDSYCHKIMADGLSVVYSTDAGCLDPKQNVSECPDVFIGADVLIYDAMLSEEEALNTKVDWGHSCSIAAIELAASANVKNLVLIHHDSICTDKELDERYADALIYAENARKLGAWDKNVLQSIVMSYDGLELKV